MRYAKTEAGVRAITDRRVPLSPRQRGIFLLFDGRRDLADVMRAAVALGVDNDDVDYMVRLGLLAPANDSPAPARLTPDELHARFLHARTVALQLTSELGLKGFQLNLEVEEALGLPALFQLLPRIREQVSPARFHALEQALRGLRDPAPQS